MSTEPRPVDLARPPQTDPGEPALVDLLRAEIQLGGPISFARFMERALYEPGLGYYATSAERPTRAGDFLTAPELHPIFGWAVARQVDEMWQRLGLPDHFVLREYGAGTGVFGAAIRDGLTRSGSRLPAVLRYEPVEIEGRLPIVADTGPMTGCVLANEFLDALPVHRVIRRDGRLQELFVDWRDGRFVEVPGDLSDTRIAEQLTSNGDGLADGHQIEVNLAMADWLAELATELKRGYVILIDYGLPRSELLSPTRTSGTIRAFRGHHVSGDVLSGAGRQDLTAHVDLDALEAAAVAAGFHVLGRTNQAEFLMGCGFDELYQAARVEADLDWDSALALRAAVRRLLDPTHLGSYAVALLGKDVEHEPALRGLGFRVNRSA